MYAVIAFVAIAICSCAKIEQETILPKNTCSLTIKLGTTKTSLGASVNGVRKVYWSNGDQIAANGTVSSEATIDAKNAGVATFDFGSEPTYPCSILYPASFYKNETTITLPHIQEAATATFATNTLPMATTLAQNDGDIHLHHLAAVVHLQLKAEKFDRNNAIRKIEFRGNNNEQVSGDFAIDYSSSKLTATSSKHADLVVYTRVLGELTMDTASDIFVVVPAQEYSKGFTVRIINSSGHYMDKKTDAATTIAEGDILKMPEFEFIPTGTLLDIEL